MWPIQWHVNSRSESKQINGKWMKSCHRNALPSVYYLIYLLKLQSYESSAIGLRHWKLVLCHWIVWQNLSYSYYPFSIAWRLPRTQSGSSGWAFFKGLENPGGLKLGVQSILRREMLGLVHTGSQVPSLTCMPTWQHFLKVRWGEVRWGTFCWELDQVKS
jgi:hypothetical protein